MSPAIILIGTLAGLLLVTIVRPYLALGLALGTPLFFRLSSAGIDFGGSVFDPQQGVTLPLSVFAAPLFVGLAIRQPLHRSTGVSRPGDRIVLLLVAWALVAFCAGVLLGRGPQPLIFLQVIGPIFFYFVGRGAVDRRALRDVLIGVALGAAAACVMLAVSAVALTRPAVYGPRLADQLIGDLVIYQAYDYFPFLLVIGFCAAVGLLVERPRVWLAGVAALHVGAILALYARVGLLALAAAVAVFMFTQRRRVNRRVRLAAVAGIAGVLAVSLVAGLASAQRVLETLQPGTATADASNRMRVDSMKAAGERILDAPVFGQAFAPTLRDPSTNMEKTLNAHNQYLDLGVRGGVPLMLLFIAVLAMAWRRTALLVHSSGAVPAITALLAILVSAILVSNMVQSTFIQPLTASALWFVVGFVFSAAARAEMVPNAEAIPPNDNMGAKAEEGGDAALAAAGQGR